MACLESYFIDIQYPLDQCEMLKKFPQFCTNPDPKRRHEYGSMDDEQIVALCRHIKFSVGKFQDTRQEVIETNFEKWLTINSGVLICLRWQNKNGHCVRLSKIISAEKYEVMNPSLGSAVWSEVTFKELVDWGFGLIVIGK